MNEKAIDKTGVPTGQAEGGRMLAEAQRACFSVNLEKMTAGIGTIFTGVMQLLAALEHDPNGATVEQTAANDNGSRQSAGKGGAENAGGTVVGDVADHGHDADRVSDVAVPAAKHDTVSAAEPAPVSLSDTGAPDGIVKGAEQKGRGGSTTLTPDDISKVVIQKIRQDRSKAATIGALLKNYGADHISKLSPGHYEAFMTEIAQL